MVSKLKLANNVNTFPIKVLLSFLVFTELLYVFGPINYNSENQLFTLLYLLLINLFMLIGFKSGLRNNVPIRSKVNSSYIGLVKKILLLSLILSFISLARKAETFNLFAILSKVIEGIIAPNDAYMSTLDSKASMITYVFMLLSPIQKSAIPLGVYCWKKLHRKYHFILVLLILIEIASWLVIGTRKGLFDIIITVIFTVIAASPDIITNNKKRKKIILVASIFICLFLVYFIWSNMARYNVTEINNYDAALNHVKKSYDKISPLIVIPLSVIENYLCQGYNALSCAITEFFNGEICMTFGFGNNFFLINLLEQFNVDILEHTYQNTLFVKHGIDPFVNWHSIYVWLANDVTFIGVPFVMFFITRFLAILWRNVINGNVLAVPSFVMTIQILAYAFANNQVLSFSFIPFIVWTFIFKYQK